MASIELKLPSMGESVMEATIISWLKKEGENIAEDEPLLEVATDKVDTEIPSMYNGVLKERLVKEGDVVQIGQPIALLSTKSDVETESKEAKSEFVSSKTSNGKQEVKPENGEVSLQAQGKNGSKSTPSKIAKATSSDRFYSPLVKNIAKEENISEAELDSIEGSGKEGRVTKNDILAYLKARDAKADNKQEDGKVPLGASDEDEVVPMDRVRKIIAERMVRSREISAHVHSFVEADVTNIVKWREAVKNHFDDNLGVKITYSPIFVEAIVKALKDFPMMNISVEGDKIIKKKRINIGMAVALPDGNLIVPVIKNADQLNLVGMARQVNDLAARARRNQLLPDEITGSTYTITNVGVYGSTMGTPIILQPNVGIMAIGTIEKKVAVVETEEHGDVMAIRHKLTLSHSYDHRVIDGALGSMFVRRVGDYLEQFDTKRTF
jgi:2-oxoglutarate dehydrogenase E2 component (dihydrolipoamide succinyltransferase)